MAGPLVVLNVQVYSQKWLFDTQKTFIISLFLFQRKKNPRTLLRKIGALCKRKPLHGALAFEWFLTHKMFSSLLWPKNAFHADWFSLQFELTKFRLHCWEKKWFPRVFHWDPVFFTRPRVFHTPGPWLRVFHLAENDSYCVTLPPNWRVECKTMLSDDLKCFSFFLQKCLKFCMSFLIE